MRNNPPGIHTSLRLVVIAACKSIRPAAGKGGRMALLVQEEFLEERFHPPKIV